MLSSDILPGSSCCRRLAGSEELGDCCISSVLVANFIKMGRSAGAYRVGFPQVPEVAGVQLGTASWIPLSFPTPSIHLGYYKPKTLQGRHNVTGAYGFLRAAPGARRRQSGDVELRVIGVAESACGQCCCLTDTTDEQRRTDKNAVF